MYFSAYFPDSSTLRSVIHHSARGAQHRPRRAGDHRNAAVRLWQRLAALLTPVLWEKASQPASGAPLREKTSWQISVLSRSYLIYCESHLF